MNSSLVAFVIFLSLCANCESANILIVVPFVYKSHLLILKPISLELARRGHNVTVLTSIKDTNFPANYRLVLSDTNEFWKENKAKLRPPTTYISKLSQQGQHDYYRNRHILFTKLILNTTAVQNFLKEEQLFDLVIVEQFYNEAFNLLAHKYNCPLALFASFGNCMKNNIAKGNPLQLSFLYSEYLKIYDFGFWSKVQNIYFTFYEYVQWRFWYLPQQEALAHEYLNLPEGVPGLHEVQKNAELFLMNKHPSVDPPTAYFQNLVEIGGLHIVDNNTLPEDLQIILDNSTQGVIFMSLGSRTLTSELTTAQRQIFTDTFRQMNQTVLWTSDVELEGLPNNVVTRTWFPQKQVLAHPHVQLFITHGGLLSIQEALWNGVPMLAVPVHADQPRNAADIQKRGIGDFLLLTELDTFQNKLQELFNKMTHYRSNAAKLMSRFRDRQASGLNTAVFWIEHVITHRGVGIQNIVTDLSWIDYYSIDVLASVLLPAVILLCVCAYVTKSVIALKKLCERRDINCNKKII